MRLGLECKPADLFRPLKLRNEGTRRQEANRWPTPTLPQISSPPEDHVEIQGYWVGEEENYHEGIVIEAPYTSTFSSWVNRPSPRLGLSSNPQASTMGCYLLHHYIFKLCVVLINVDGPANPLRNVVLPRAVTSQTLMNALYATSALHVFVGKCDPKFRVASLAYYSKAVSGLLKSISNFSSPREPGEPEILLLTAVFLCKYEILSGGVSNWRSHLEAVRQLFTAVRQQQSRLAPETVAYVQSL